MKSLLLKIINIIAVIVLMYLLANRYMSWGINEYSVLMFASISGFAMVMLINSLIGIGNKVIITPNTVYFLFVFLFGYSFIPLSNANEQIEIDTFIVLFFSVFFFLTGIYIGKGIKLKISPLPIQTNIRILIFRLTFIFSFIVFLLECARVGFIPLFNMFSVNVYEQMSENAIPILHYFVQMVNILPILAYILHKKNLISSNERNIVLAGCAFIMLNSLSRQTWVLTIICFGVYYMFYYVLSKKKFLIVLFLTLILFLGIGAIRLLTITYDDRSNVEYLKDYSDIDYDANLVEVYLGLYSTNNFTTLKRFVKTADDANYLGLGVYTFKPVFTLLGLSKFDSFDINKDLDSFSALGTYAIEPYLDFGLIGVIFINLFYGIFVSYTYKRYREGKERWIVPWGVMAFCLVMAAFTNFFNTFFVWFVLTLNFLILAPSNNYGKK